MIERDESVIYFCALVASTYHSEWYIPTIYELAGRDTAPQVSDSELLQLGKGERAFLFAVYDDPTGQVSFVGRFSEP